MSLKEEMAKYSDELLAYAAKAYNADGSLKKEVFGQPDFQETPEAMVDAIDAHPHLLVQSDDKFHDVSGPVIVDFLQNNAVTALSPLTKSWGFLLKKGGDAVVFEALAREAGSLRLAFRVGSRVALDANDGFLQRSFNRPLCPLVLQPLAQTALAWWSNKKASYLDAQLGLELLPLVPVLSRSEPQGFDKFLNEHILIGTPYAVDGHKDLGLLADGTPVFVDPDSLNFKTNALAERHAKDQLNPVWQQGIMAIIAENCRAIGTPPCLTWLVPKPNGTYETKQETLYRGAFSPNPATHSLIRLREPG